MHLITNILNDYWKTAGMVETFSFGWSYHYDMEFSKLVYKKWATRLVLESIKDGLLARIQLAMEAVEECYSCTGHVSNMPKLITMAQVTTQDRYLQAEDLQWEWQLLLDRRATLPNIAAAAIQKLPPEQLRWQKDWDHTHHLNVMNKEQAFTVPWLTQAMLLHDDSSDENMNHRSCRLEAMNSKTITTNPVFHDHSSTLCTASRMEKTMTTLGSYGDKVPTLSRERTARRLPFVTKPADALDPCHMTRLEQSSTVMWGWGQPPASDYSTCFAVPGTTRHRPPDRVAPFTESTDPQTSKERDDYGASSTTHPKESWRGTLLLGQDCNDRVRSPLDESRDRRTKQEMFLPGLMSNLRRELLPSSSPQGSPYHDDQGLTESQQIAIVSNVHQRSDSACQNTSHTPSLKNDATTSVHRIEQPTRACQPIQPHNAQPLRTETKASCSQAPSNSQATLDTAVTSGYHIAPNHSDGRVPDATADAPFSLPFVGPYQVTMAFCSNRSYDPVRRNLTCLPSSRTTTLAHQDRKLWTCLRTAAIQTQEESSTVPEGADNTISLMGPSTPEPCSHGTEFRWKAYFILTIPTTITPRISPDMESRGTPGQLAKTLVEQPYLEKKLMQGIVATTTEPTLKLQGFTKAATTPKVGIRGHQANESSTLSTHVQLTNCLTMPSSIPESLACPDQTDSEGQPTLANLTSEVPRESVTNRKVEPIQSPPADEQCRTLQSPRDKVQTSSSDSAMGIRIRSQGN